MNKDASFFNYYNKYGLEGYYIPVRNTFNKCIEKEFIPKVARPLFEETFGETVITDKEFIDWYTEYVSEFQ